MPLDSLFKNISNTLQTLFLPSATFVNPLTAGNQGTAAYGFGQGGFGSSPSLGSMQTWNNMSGLSGAGGTLSGISGLGSFGSPPSKAQSPFGHARQLGVRTTGTNQVGSMGQNAGLTAGTQMTAEQSAQFGQSQAIRALDSRMTGGFAKDAFGRPLVNEKTGKPVPSTPQAYRTNPLTGQREYITDQNGNPIPQNLTQFQAEQSGLTAEELKSSGYTWFGGTWVYNPSGGSGAGGAGGNSNLAWWQKPQSWAGNRTFSSEKEANKAYNKYKGEQQKIKDAENPKKNGQGKKAAGAGVTAATSFYGTG